MERLTPEFDTISTLFYGLHDGICNTVRSVAATSDGGLVLVTSNRNLNSTKYNCTISKFPAEVFVGIDEAHDNGLKVAIAYPNPGKDVLNIRTGLQNARVEVYDMNGRLLHSHALTGHVTAIDAEDWAEGVYVWKVITKGNEVESGKWVKE